MEYPADVMTITEVAELIGTARKTVYQWCHIPKNKFAFRNPGGTKIRIRTREFDEWYRKNTDLVGARR